FSRTFVSERTQCHKDSVITATNHYNHTGIHMGRKPTDLGPDADDRIMALMSRGASPVKVHEALRAAGLPEIGVRTVARRMAALRPEVHAGRRPAVSPVATPPEGEKGPPLPSTPDEIPADASMAILEHYRRLARASIDAASDEGDLKLVAQLINMAGALEDRIKARTPRPVEDPNDAPDMRALGGEVMERMLKAVDLVTEEM
ncbi:MAG TPA: hypothetical protein VNJ04_05235, partial [Gemmatimonadaceae bacterium]|nr:hypothetical protein [Gemmatimonadaceae bacterium]